MEKYKKPLMLISGILIISIIGLLIARNYITKVPMFEEDLEGEAPVRKASKGEIMVTNYDSTYDYKHSGGVWYSARKNSGNWTNLKTALSADKYKTVENRLAKYL